MATPMETDCEWTLGKVRTFLERYGVTGLHQESSGIEERNETVTLYIGESKFFEKIWRPDGKSTVFFYPTIVHGEDLTPKLVSIPRGAVSGSDFTLTEFARFILDWFSACTMEFKCKVRLGERVAKKEYPTSKMKIKAIGFADLYYPGRARWVKDNDFGYPRCRWYD